MPKLVTKPKLIRAGEAEASVVEKTNYNVLDLWKRWNVLNNELEKVKVSANKPITILRWKNWRVREVDTVLLLEYYSAGAWTEDSRAEIP
jgi:hypothetical protein